MWTVKLKNKPKKKFIYLGAPLLWKEPNDTKLYIIGVHASNSNEKCGDSDGESTATSVFNYIGWILEHVEGEICSTLDNIDDWFDEQKS